LPNLRLTMKNRLPWVVCATLVFALVPARATAQRTASAVDSARIAAAQRSPKALVHARAAGVPARPPCAWPAACADSAATPQSDEVANTRRRYALIGFAAGAGVGWLMYSNSCRTTDCYGTFLGVLLATGTGLVGMIAGLLIAPSN
jgi:hypothetical protein